MIVTNIEDLAKGRYRVSLDGEFAFVLYRGELTKYKIELDKELEQEKYFYILDELLPKRAKLRAMNLLMKHSFTEQQLRNKLIEGEYPDRIIDEAMEYVKSFHYIDDEAYTRDFITSHSSDKSIARMRMDLSNKGIHKDVFNKVLMELEEQGDSIDENTQINKLLYKKKYNPRNATYEETLKIYAFLMRKGYSFEQIRKCIDGFDCLT